MKQVLGTVKANIELSPTTHILVVHAPEIARHSTPGQFVHARCVEGSDPLLRRPLSISRIRLEPNETNRRDEEFALLVEVVGRGSGMLASTRVGEQIDLMGPLGRGFTLHPASRQIVLVAGGFGVAPLLALANEALVKDMAVTLLLGARTASRVFPASLVPAEVEYRVFTEDGSAGRTGLVTEGLPDLVEWADQLFACGPTPMLKAVAGVVRARGLLTRQSNPPLAQVSLEQHMGCAVGACYGCVVETNSGRQRVCRDGPVFDLFDIRWW